MNTCYRSTLAVLFSTALLSSSAQAQGFNLDINWSGLAIDSIDPSYAAAGTAGIWNEVEDGPIGPFSLADKAGAPTAISMTFSSGLTHGWAMTSTPFSGEDAKLLNDVLYDTASLATVSFTGITNGVYDVYTYAIAPEGVPDFTTGVDVSNAPGGKQIVGGAQWTGSHVQGTSYAKHRSTVVDGTLTITLTTVNALSLMSWNGLQLESVEAGNNPGTAYCFGDGTGVTCPCSAFGAAGAGCLNSSGTGAILSATGSAEIANDTLTLVVSGAAPNKPGLFFQGTNQVSTPIGDGILCSNSTLRYAINSTDASGTAVQNGFGANASMGSGLNYQYWFRDPQNACGNGFNFSNGWAVTWQ